ncbi:hypothetical protein [Sandarakinorhabdus rubra]|uniref:hypothetical protein n=1 Tax=Sandarakinorhabdus rubra TaxID=2672568 RepID=UPI0013DA60D5|nr:hypothetical protein [Sandarakinorhabdus rubra]
MTSLVLGDLSRLFFVAAPFTLLPSVAVQLLLPPLPATVAELSGQQILFYIVLPFLTGNFAQLVVTALLLRPDITPREAFARALPLWLPYLGVLLLASLPVGFGLLLLLLPGLYLYARLGFLASTLMVTEGGAPMAVLRRGWQLSERAQGVLFLFLLVAMFGVIGVLMLAGIAGSAVSALATLVGADAVGRFLVALLGGAASTMVAIAGAAASVVCWRQLRG